jgi:hypothetical protein
MGTDKVPARIDLAFRETGSISPGPETRGSAMSIVQSYAGPCSPATPLFPDQVGENMKYNQKDAGLWKLRAS